MFRGIEVPSVQLDVDDNVLSPVEGLSPREVSGQIGSGPSRSTLRDIITYAAPDPAETGTLDEPVRETIKRDLLRVFNNVKV